MDIGFALPNCVCVVMSCRFIVLPFARCSRACLVFCLEDAAVSAVGVAGQVYEDQRLFRGGVPQVGDWLNAWRSCRTPVSFRKAEKFGITANFVHGGRQQLPVSRKAFRSMVKVMSLVLRRRKRKLLRSARSMSLALDDRGSYRLLRFKCDAVRPQDVDPLQWTGSVTGVLMVLHRGGAPSKMTMDDVSDDYSRKMSESVVRAFERLCTNADGSLDHEALDAVFKIIRIAVADGAASVQKALRFLACGPAPNLLAVVRDMAHKARIFRGDPLLADEGFKSWWDDVFGERHALVPDIQNSEAWTEKLILCQRLLLNDSGVRESGCWAVQETLSFAKQRFDSYASPQLKFCVLLVALAMLLAYQVSDPRTKSNARSRAQRRLEQMPHYVLPAGLSATFSAEALEFVRKFDVSDHDPACTWMQSRDWQKRMTTLFIDGHVWASSDGSADKTPMQIVYEQAKAAKPIWYGDKVCHLLHKPSAERMRALSVSMHTVLQHSFDRMDVDFDVERPEIAFTALDVGRWEHALTERRAERHDSYDLLLSHAKIMFTHWGLDGRRGVRELEGCAVMLLQDEADRRKAGVYLDNRTLWSRTTEQSFLDRVSSYGVLRVLPDLLSIYLSALDGTGEVERGLGHLTEILHAHSGPLQDDGDMASALIEIMLDGPDDETGIGVRPDMGHRDDLLVDVDVVLQPTDLCREFAEQWLESHGRRYRVYSGHGNAEAQYKKAPRLGTMARVAFGSKVARDRVVKNAASAPPAHEDATIVTGVRRSVCTPGSSLVRRGGDRMQQFAKTTSERRAQLRRLTEARRDAAIRRMNPYAMGQDDPRKTIRSGHKMEAVKGVVGHGVGPARPGAPIRVLDCCQEVLPNREGNRYSLVRSAQQTVSEVQRADMIVWDHSWALDRTVTDKRDRFLQLAFAIIALGKATLDRDEWQRNDNPHHSQRLNRYARAVSQKKITLVLPDAFQRDFPRLCGVIKLTCSARNSLWTVTNTTPAPEAEAKAKAKAKARLFAKAKAKSKAAPIVVSVACLEDVRLFLQRHRSFARSGGVASEYLKRRLGRLGLPPR